MTQYRDTVTPAAQAISGDERLFDTFDDFIAGYSPTLGTLSDACAAYDSGFVGVGGKQYYCDGVSLSDPRNAVAKFLPKWRAGLASVIAGTGNSRICCIGDSTTAGTSSAGNGWVNARLASYPNQLITLLNNMGIYANGGCAIGSGTPTDSQFLGYDPRWTFGSGWATNTVVTLGAGTINNNGAGALTAANFTPAQEFDTIDIWYIQNSGYGTFTIGVDGGAAVGAAVSAAGTLSIQKATRTVTKGLHTLNITKTVTGNILICGINTYDSTKSRVDVFNCARGGGKVADISADTNVWDPLKLLRIYAPDLSIIALTINDWIAATASGSFTTSTQAIIAAARESGDVVLATGFPSKTTSASLANQDAITAALRPIAANMGLPLIDISQEWGLYTTALAAGYFAPENDPVHPGPTGYAYMAQRVFESLF